MFKAYQHHRHNNNIIGQIFPSSWFTWNPKTRTFVGEMSIVDGCTKQLFADAVDCGFGIKSEKTGSVALFTLESAERDKEGDILSWRFQIYDQEICLRGISVVVFNT